MILNHIITSAHHLHCAVEENSDFFPYGPFPEEYVTGIDHDSCVLNPAGSECCS